MPKTYKLSITLADEVATQFDQKHATGLPMATIIAQALTKFLRKRRKPKLPV